MRNKNELHMTPAFWVGHSMDDDTLYQDRKYRSKNKFGGKKIGSALNLLFLRHLRNILVKISNGQLDT